MLDNYKDYISEASKSQTKFSKEELNKYMDRFKHLEGMAVSLFGKINKLHPKVSKYKRANLALRRLEEVFDKIANIKSIKIEGKNKKPMKLIIGKRYYYSPNYVRQAFLNYIISGVPCTLLNITDHVPKVEYCDCTTPEECTCFVEVSTLLLGKVRFYTKPESLYKL